MSIQVILRYLIVRFIFHFILQTLKEENRAMASYADCLDDSECLAACWDNVTTTKPDPQRGNFLGYYALDMHWSAFPKNLNEANLSSLNTILNKVVGNKQIQVSNMDKNHRKGAVEPQLP